jgi:hypothetical protein
MCTTILFHLKNSQIGLTKETVQGLCLGSGLWASFDIASFAGYRSMIELLCGTEKGIDFDVWADSSSRCSCDVVENVRESAQALSSQPPRLFVFLRRLMETIGGEAVFVSITSYPPPEMIAEHIDVPGFEKEMLHHYGWRNDQDSRDWNYDMHRSFLIHGLA